MMKQEQFNKILTVNLITLIFQFLAFVLLLSIAFACEPILTSPEHIRYSGTITYDLPSYQQTTPASRTFYNGTVTWWPGVSGTVTVVNNQYTVDSIAIRRNPSCLDTLYLAHSGIGEFIPDSLIEQGTVIYYRRSGTLEVTEIGTYIFKGARVPNQ